MMWQWIVVAIIVVLAVICFLRSLRRDPCSRCTLKERCTKSRVLRSKRRNWDQKCYQTKR